MEKQNKTGNLKVKEDTVRHVLDVILRNGGGNPGSIFRIFAKYRIGKSRAYMTEFLKKEYGTTGMGFTIGGHKVSAWFDENGMKAGLGMSAHENTFLVLDWNQIEARIRGMVRSAEYMSEPMVIITEEMEQRRVAGELLSYFRGNTESMPESFAKQGASYFDPEGSLSKMLETQEGRDAIRAELMRILKIKKKDDPFEKPAETEKLLSEIKDLEADWISLPDPGMLPVIHPDFITRDETDAALCCGTERQDSKKRIFRYFMENHTEEERADFLRREYGMWAKNGILPGNSDSWLSTYRDRIEVMHGDILHPACTAELSWMEAQKRIGELIEKGRYLSPERAVKKKPESLRGKLMKYSNKAVNLPQKSQEYVKHRKREAAL